jgi:hypothetical protein
MNTSRTTPRLSKPVDSEPVPPATLEYMRTRNRMRIFNLVHNELKHSGITRAQLSKRMGRGLDRISHLLGAPGNWTLDTASDLLFAISGAEIKYEASHPLNKSPRNQTRPEWLEDERGRSSALESGKQSLGALPPPGGLAAGQIIG